MMIHQAGKLIDGIQTCDYCGRVLADYRNSPEHDWVGWEVGARIEINEQKPTFSGRVIKAVNCLQQND